jgi:hypothetical protein
MNIEITNDQSAAINNLLAVGKKIDAIKALREYHRTPGYNYDGFPNPCTLSLKEAKDAIEHRMGQNDNPSAKLVVKNEFRIEALSVTTSAGYVTIEGSGRVFLPAVVTSIEDMRKLVNLWDRVMG